MINKYNREKEICHFEYNTLKYFKTFYSIFSLKNNYRDFIVKFKSFIIYNHLSLR